MTMPTTDQGMPPGSHWWKCDLHIHTPASTDDFTDKAATPEQWVNAAASNGIEVAAVTDHHGFAWIERLRAAAQGRLVLFPGMEIRVSEGFHVLVILDTSARPQDLSALLGACQIPSDQFGRNTASSPLSFHDMSEQVRRRGGLCIAAHVDGPDGLLTRFAASSPDGRPVGDVALMKIIVCANLLGAEVKDAAPATLSFLDNSKDGYKREDGPLAVLEGSDAHRLADIGRRHTWIKMSRPNLEGLRLALLDGPASVRRGSSVTSDINETAVDRIQEITVDDAKYLGRGQPFRLGLSPWLNAVIGGHGTGKSTLVEFLRIAMRREGEIPESLQGELSKYSEVPQGRQDRGLLTDQTRIQVIYRRDGSRFRLQWSTDGSLSPIEVQDGQGDWSTAPGEVRTRFPIRIFSQKQIYQLADEPSALLRVIDEAAPVSAASWRTEFEDEEKRFRSLRAKVRELETSAESEERVRGQLDEVRRRMTLVETSQHREVLAAYRSVQAEARALDEWTTSLETAVGTLDRLPSQLALDDVDRGSFPAGLPPDDPRQYALAQVDKAAAAWAGLKGEAGRLAARARTIRDGITKALASPPWSDHVQGARARYEELRRQLAAAGVGDPAQFGRLVQERETLEARLKTIEARKASVADVRKQANDSLVRLAEIRAELTERRRTFLESVTGAGGNVLIRIVPYGGAADAERQLREAIGRPDQTFQDQIWSEDGGQGILRDLYEMTPPERDPSAFHDAFVKVKARLVSVARGGEATGLHGKFVAHLRKLTPEAVERIEAMFPEDSIRVSYRPRPGDDYRPLEQGSPGQKSAAILAFLLSHGSEPLVMDQPEDDLDGSLISNLIVAQLRALKSKRQVLVVTHNPNIVVNGDAELVTCLGVRNGQSYALSSGGLQENDIREEICSVMEGGREALDRRYRRIRGGTRDV
jgi:energy-coupling factor transporter ATP-binding protein EcfA2